MPESLVYNIREVIKLKEINAELYKLALELEYSVKTDRAIMGECPICTFPLGKGHHKECTLAKAIAKAQEG